MLFQASEENSDPTCATHSATSRPSTPAAAVRVGSQPTSGAIVAGSTRVHMFEKLAAIASALRPTRMPSTMSAKSDSVLAEVKTFWISLPRRMPRVLRKVRKITITIATSCCVDRLTA